MASEVRLQGIACVLGDYGMASRIQGTASRHAARTGLKIEIKEEKHLPWVRDPRVKSSGRKLQERGQNMAHSQR